MRTSTVALLAIAAAAAPALAAPTYPAEVHTRSLGPDVAARDFNELSAREVNDLLERSTFSDFASGFEKGFVGTIKTLAPIALSLVKKEDLNEFAARDINELNDILARSTFSDFASGFEKGFVGTIKTLAPIALSLVKKEDLNEFAARDLSELNDILARSTFSDFASGFEKGFVGTLKTLAPIALSLVKKEDVDARSFGKDLLNTVETLAPIALDFIKREEVARGFGKDLEKGLEFAAPLALSFLKREDVARGFGKDLLNTVETLAPIALDFIKREEVARSTFSDFASGFEKGFTGTIKALAPIAVDLLSREDLELLARSYPEMNVARSLNELD